MQEAIVKKLGKAAATSARQYLQMAIDKFELLPDSLSTFLDARKPFGAAANSYLQALFSSDRHEARRVLLRLKTTGVSFAELCENIFEPVQREVGRLWQLHHISVAQEHYCTQSTEILMSEMRSEEEQGKRNGHLFVGACVAGEQHSIGMRMVSEMMEAHGWSVYCTGANTPTASLVDLVGRLKVQVLGISCASVLNLMAVRELTQAVRQASPRTKIAVGGRVFNESPGLWKKIGADIFAEKATSAPQAAARLLERKKAAARHA
jgi:methanogenic corrinoid protein MtbC1